MANPQEELHRLLQGMRVAFLEQLAERCDMIERLILVLENEPDNREAFNELYRVVHSLKGSGGTHGLGIITAICHQLENLLAELAEAKCRGEAFASSALAHVDLLRRVDVLARAVAPDFSSVEAGLERLRQTTSGRGKTCLIAESSATMRQVYAQILSEAEVRVTTVDNGLVALQHLVRESYDLAIIGRELKELDGLGVILALRASRGLNQRLPVIMVTSRQEAVPAHAGIDVLLMRDQSLAEQLSAAVQHILSA